MGAGLLWTRRTSIPYGARHVKAACAMERTTAAMSGEHWACMSSNGARDMVGSVWEWTATPMQAKALTVRPGETLREIRGAGAWSQSRELADLQMGTQRPLKTCDIRIWGSAAAGKADIDDMFQPWSKEQKAVLNAWPIWGHLHGPVRNIQTSNCSHW